MKTDRLKELATHLKGTKHLPYNERMIAISPSAIRHDQRWFNMHFYAQAINDPDNRGEVLTCGCTAGWAVCRFGPMPFESSSFDKARVLLGLSAEQATSLFTPPPGWVRRHGQVLELKDVTPAMAVLAIRRLLRGDALETLYHN